VEQKCLLDRLFILIMIAVLFVVIAFGVAGVDGFPGERMEFSE